VREIVIFILVVWGVTSVVTFGAIVRPVRHLFARSKYTRNNIGYLLHCPMCTGWWAGLGIHFVMPLSTLWWTDAFIGAGVCYLLRAVFVYACEDCAMNLPEFNDVPVQGEQKEDGVQHLDSPGT
jgi:hypothetical protein